MSDFISGLRVAAATMAICVAGYTALILGFAQAVTPATANGSLVTNEDGEIVGSRVDDQRQMVELTIKPDQELPRSAYQLPTAVDFKLGLPLRWTF